MLDLFKPKNAIETSFCSLLIIGIILIIVSVSAPQLGSSQAGDAINAPISSAPQVDKDLNNAGNVILLTGILAAIVGVSGIAYDKCM